MGKTTCVVIGMLLLVWLTVKPAIALPPRGSEALLWEELNAGIPAVTGIVALAWVPVDPRIVYVATADPAGFFRSDDGGLHWQPVTGVWDDIGVLSIAVSPVDTAIVYLGTVNGLYRLRIDAGVGGERIRTAQLDRLLDREIVYALLCFGGQDIRVLAGTEGGVFLSTDGGGTWERNPAVPSAVLSLARDDHAGGCSCIYGGTVSQGVWVSCDDGLTWEPAGGLVADETIPAVRVGNRGKVYAWAGHTLFHAEPAGSLPVQWQPVVLPAGWEPFSFALGEPLAEYEMAGRREECTDRLYVGSRGRGVIVGEKPCATESLWRQNVGGLRWADVTCLEAHPTDPEVAFLGTQFYGLYRTDDGGVTWRAASVASGRRTVMALAQHPVDSEVWYAGTLAGVYRSSDGGQRWEPLTDSLGRLMVQGLAIDPVRPEQIYAATQVGVFRSGDGGTTWQWCTEDLGKINTFNVVTATGVQATTVYAGSWGNNVLRSEDNGRSWTPIHNGLETLSVHAFAVDPEDPAVLYAGTVEHVFRSDDGGNSWRVSGDGMRPALTTFALALDPYVRGRVYAGTTAGVYRSDTGGLSWAFSSAGLGEITVNTLAVDPVREEIVYVGTEHRGMYRSDDGGTHWTSWGLRDSSVYAIVIDDTGGIWAGTEQGVFKAKTR